MRMSMEQTTHFGYSTVNLEEKAGLVQSLFSDVAVSYDLMNDVMSFGVHRIGKTHSLIGSNLKRGKLS